MPSNSDFEIDGMHVIFINPDDESVDLNDITIQHGGSPPPQSQASQDGGNCGNDDNGDPQCMIREVEVDEEVV